MKRTTIGHKELKDLAKNKTIPTCDVCNHVTTEGGKYGKLHRCDCGMRSWNYKPLATKATGEARVDGHNAFDRLWKPRRDGGLGIMRRGEAYKKLTKDMGLKPNFCHFSCFTQKQANRATEICKRYIEEHKVKQDQVQAGMICKDCGDMMKIGEGIPWSCDGCILAGGDKYSAS